MILVHFHSSSSFVAGCDETPATTKSPAAKTASKGAVTAAAPAKNGGGSLKPSAAAAAGGGVVKSAALIAAEKKSASLEGNYRSKQKFVRARKGRSLSETKHAKVIIQIQ